MKPESACKYLEHKAYFFAPPAHEDETAGPRTLSTPFWCLLTHEALGPDGDEACDETCGPQRACYQPEVEL